MQYIVLKKENHARNHVNPMEWYGKKIIITISSYIQMKCNSMPGNLGQNQTRQAIVLMRYLQIDQPAWLIECDPSLIDIYYVLLLHKYMYSRRFRWTLLYHKISVQLEVALSSSFLTSNRISSFQIMQIIL